MNIIAEKYCLLEKTVKGQSGDVYKAKDMDKEKIVALKLFHIHLKDNIYLSHIKREAEYVLSLNLEHRNIVKILNFEHHEDYVFLVMEYITGNMIKDYIKQSPSKIRDILNFTIQICDGLDYFHSLNLVYRNIRPEKIFINEDLNVKLLSYGLNLARPGAGKSSRMGMGSFGTGGSQYIPPEYIEGKNFTHLSDLYSLGVTLYELLTDKLPFPDDEESFFPQLGGKPAPLTEYNRGISGELEGIVLSLLERKPEKRLQSVKELKERINLFAEKY